jgi:acyl dehydratase
MAARFWDDLIEGDQLECRPVILDLEEIVEFAKKFDPQVFHIDEEVAATLRFKGIIASSLHTLSASTRVIVDALNGIEILIGLGILEVSLPNAVRPDDILSVDARWTDLRRSESKPGQGLATVKFTLRNQRGDTVLESGFKYMIACRKNEQAQQV